jgi:hypothetical protein
VFNAQKGGPDLHDRFVVDLSHALAGDTEVGSDHSHGYFSSPEADAIEVESFSPGVPNLPDLSRGEPKLWKRAL